MKVGLKRRLTFAGVFLPSFLLATIMRGFFPGISRFEGGIIQVVFTVLLMVCFMSIITLNSLEKRMSELEAEIEALKKKSV